MKDIIKALLTQLNDFTPPTLALESKRREISLDVIAYCQSDSNRLYIVAL